MRHYFGIILGALATYLLLIGFHGGRFIEEPRSAYFTAVAGGAIVTALWPWIFGLWAAARARARVRARVESEVSRQIIGKKGPPPAV